MIFEAETALLDAVHNRLMNALKLDPNEIDIEVDDAAPAIVGQRYFMITPAQAAAGRHAQQGDKTHHNLFGCRVAVVHRTGVVPRDKMRTAMRRLNAELSIVSRILRFDYETINAAHADLTAQNIAGSFIRPLVPTSADAKPRLVAGDLFGAKPGNTGGAWAGILRGVTFTGAEFIGKEPTA